MFAKPIDLMLSQKVFSNKLWRCNAGIRRIVRSLIDCHLPISFRTNQIEDDMSSGTHENIANLKMFLRIADFRTATTLSPKNMEL